MTRWCFVSLVTVTAALLVAQSAQAEDRALLVGIGVYERQSPFRDLSGIDRDLGTMQEVVRELGFEQSQIRVLADEEATLEGIRSAFQSWLIDAVGPGERALFYFSGHGYQVIDRDDDEQDGEDEVLVPHDYRGTAEALTNVVVDDDMEAWIGRLRTDDVLIFLDACHSGTAVKSAAGPSGWSMFDGDAAKGVSTKSADGADAGYLALAAARDDEQAQATPSGSTFTIGIGRAVRDAAASGSPLTMNGISERAAAEIARAHPTQVVPPGVERGPHESRPRLAAAEATAHGFALGSPGPSHEYRDVVPTHRREWRSVGVPSGRQDDFRGSDAGGRVPERGDGGGGRRRGGGLVSESVVSTTVRAG